MDPFDDADLIAGEQARDSGDLPRARLRLEAAASRNNPVALLDLLDVCFDLGDHHAVKAHLAHLEALAERSAESAYAASKAYECGPWLNLVAPDQASAKRKEHLLQSGRLGNPMAQIEIAANFGYGTNGFVEDLASFREWIARAAEVLPLEAARCFSDVASTKAIAVPEWAREALAKHDA